MQDGMSIREFEGIVPQLRKSLLSSLSKQQITGYEVKSSPMSDGPLSWWHKPECDEKAPVVFELHGGGFALGDARKEDRLCELIKDSFGVHVVGLNYRLSPDYPWPAALEDVLDALRYYARHAEEFGMDSSLFYFLGYSAGANLAVAASIASREAKQYQVEGCALHYPFLDAARDRPEEAFRDVDLSKSMAVAFNDWYVGDNDPSNPLISPALAPAEMLEGLPLMSLYPVVGDVLSEDAEEFYEHLEKHGIPCAIHRVEGAYHGYIEDAANVRVSREMNLPETLSSRPAGYSRKASSALCGSIAEILDRQARDFPSILDEGAV